MPTYALSLNKVKSWSECVRKRFEQQNCLYLPTNDLNEAIAPSSVHDFMQNSLSATQSLTTQVAELQNVVTVQARTIDRLVDTISKLNDRIESLSQRFQPQTPVGVADINLTPTSSGALDTPMPTQRSISDFFGGTPSATRIPASAR